MTTTFRGFEACTCLAKWLPVFEQALLEAGEIKHNIDIYQLIGGAKASAGTHSTGGAFDIAQGTTKVLRIARDMGADATWRRKKNWDGRGGMAHTHGVLRGCPHNGPARYQIAAVDAGYNGLGLNGHGGKDDGPRPLSKRTWEQGITYAEEHLMAVSEDDIKKIIDGFLNADVVPNSTASDEDRKANPTITVKTALDWAIRGNARIEEKLDTLLGGDKPEQVEPPKA